MGRRLATAFTRLPVGAAPRAGGALVRGSLRTLALKTGRDFGPLGRSAGESRRSSTALVAFEALQYRTKYVPPDISLGTVRWAVCCFPFRRTQAGLDAGSKQPGRGLGLLRTTNTFFGSLTSWTGAINCLTAAAGPVRVRQAFQCVGQPPLAGTASCFDSACWMDQGATLQATVTTNTAIRLPCVGAVPVSCCMGRMANVDVSASAQHCHSCCILPSGNGFRDIVPERTTAA